MTVPTPALTLDAWLQMAVHSARARQLPELEPLLIGLVPALRTVRDAYATMPASAEHATPTLRVEP